MVQWYHAIVSAYGFWLPNDPRGSWSDFVRAWELFRFGGLATKVADNRIRSHDPHNAGFRREVKRHLKYPPARFDEACRASIVHGFERACAEFGFVVHACAIGFDHTHLVLERNEVRSSEQIISVMKSRATRQMNLDGTNPMRRYGTTDGSIPTPWGKNGWSVYIDNVEHLRCAIDYVTRHPMKEGLAPQPWVFLTPVIFPV